MRNVKKVLRVPVLAGAVLALLLWSHSPGPEWLAQATAERYAQRYAADYRYHALVMEGEVCRRIGVLSLRYPSWTVGLSREEDPARQGHVLRLELSGGIFPIKVSKAGWWTAEDGPVGTLPHP